MTLTISEQKHDGYERIVEFSDDTDFRCFIAIHNTRLGPSLGGCRLKPYASTGDALLDVMRLSKGMTYKSSLAGLFYGGGKCVVMAEKATREVMLKVGEAVNHFDGLYVTAEDVGTTLADIETVAEVSPHTVHLDGSAMTARGVLACMQAAVKWQGHWGDSLSGIPIWVQGLGKVGMDLAKRLLTLDVPNIHVTDLRNENVREAIDHGARELTEKERKFIAVYSPCAMGQVITPVNAEVVNYSIICGSANNQLLTDDLAKVLQRRDVLYAPDFLVNAGGVINAAYEIGQTFDQDKCEIHTDNLGEVLINIFDLAKSDGVTPLRAAMTFAEARFV